MSDRPELLPYRKVAIVTVLGLIAFTAVVDNLGRLYVNPDFHVSEILFGSLVALEIGLLGLEGLNILRNHHNDRN